MNPGNASLPCSILAPENAANLQEGPIAPGELVTLWGLRFGPETGAQMKFDSTGTVSTQLAGVDVFFDEIRADPVCAIRADQRAGAVGVG